MEKNILNKEAVFLSAGGSGTASDPYLISEKESFLLMNYNLSAYYKLSADLDLTGETITPIGTYELPFTGGLDGDGHAIRNYKAENSKGNAGILAYAKSANIKNLLLENVEVTAQYSAGALGGQLEKCTIANVKVKNAAIKGGGNVGGLAGYLISGSVMDCSAEDNSTVSGGSQIGGLIGYSNGANITRCYVDGDMRVNGGNSVGGLLGVMAYGMVSACKTSADTTGGDRTGGLLGSVDSNTANIMECCAAGNVIGKEYVGGLIGYASAVIGNSYATGSVTSTVNSVNTGGLTGITVSAKIINCYAAGKVSNGGKGLANVPVLSIGKNNTVITNSYFDSVASGVSVFDANNTGKLTSGLLKKASFQAWDFTSTWDIEEGVTYPYLRRVDQPGGRQVDIGAQPTGGGKYNDPYLIGNAEQFQYMKNDWSGYYKLSADLDLTGETITPIGTYELPFTGGLDGDGHAIRNLKIEGKSTGTGIFAYARGATVKNLVIEQGEITQPVSYYYVGTIAGSAQSCTMENIMLTDVNITGGGSAGVLAGFVRDGRYTDCLVRGGSKVNGTGQIGGQIGTCYGGNYIRCSVGKNVTVYATGSAGGLIGQLSGGSINNCYAAGDVTGGDYTGGLAGAAENSGAGIYLSYATGNVTGKERVGGLVGKAGAVITSCFATGNVTSTTNSLFTGGFTGAAESATISNCYSAGKVSAGGKGFAHVPVFAIGTNNTRIINCLFDSVASGVSVFDANNTGKLTSGLLKKASFTAWDFTSTWDIEEGITYPYLRGMDQPEGSQVDISSLPAGAGTQADPYLIKNKNQFFCIKSDINSYYRLAADIDLSGEVIVPIGSTAFPFKGGLDGNSYTVRNLKIIASSAYAGLFAYASSAQFKNLTFYNSEITQSSPSSYVGILGGSLAQCIVENIKLVNTAITAGSNIGALAGIVVGGSVTGCLVMGETRITGINYLGGLVGSCSSTRLSNCQTEGTGSITGTDYIGGLTGHAPSGIIQQCFAAIMVNGNDYTGGLAGSISDSSSGINECYAIGKVTGRNYVGGLTGYTRAPISNSFAAGSVTSTANSTTAGGLTGYSTYSSIKNCYAAGRVSTGGSGLVYPYTGTTILNSFFDGIAAGISTNDFYNVSKLMPGLMRKASFPGWDFNTVWEISETGSYPYLQKVKKPEQFHNIHVFLQGAGTTQDPYLIGCRKDFDMIRCDLGAFFRLTADIDFKDEAIIPIGTYATPFAGGLDGDGFCIKSFKINSNNTYIGLFAYLNKAVIENLTIRNACITQPSSSSYIGALAGYSKECKLVNITLTDITVQGGSYAGILTGTGNGGSITGCHVTKNSSVTGAWRVGGLTGELYCVMAKNCGIHASVIGNDYSGGLAGMASGTSCSINECYTSGSVKGSAYVGGLAGYTNISIYNCYADCAVTSTTNSFYAGGLIGYSYGTNIRYCYAAGTITPGASGLVYIYSTTSVVSSYFDSTQAGITTPTAYAKTTLEMWNKETYAGWDLISIWSDKENSYPVLKNVLDPAEQEPIELTYRDLTHTSIYLEWGEVAEAGQYEIIYNYKKTVSQNPHILLTDLDPETEYTFRVRVLSEKSVGSWSKVLLVQTKKIPSIDGINSTTNESGRVTLSWKQPENAQSYEVIYQDHVLHTAGNECEMTDLQTDIPYVIKIRALLADGSSVVSEPVIIKIWKPDPQTEYGAYFIKKCQGQTWFLNEIENILNLKGKSIQTINSKNEFATIYALGLADRGIHGEIPPAIGELSSLEYLYLGNNDLSGDIPLELSSLEKIVEIDLSGNHFNNETI